MNFIKLLLLFTELFKFEIQKCGQILCAHKPYFLILDYILMYHSVVKVKKNCGLESFEIKLQSGICTYASISSSICLQKVVIC